MLKAALFDLDGTLLPMDQDAFVKAYFGYMTKKMYSHGYTDPQKLIKSIWACTMKVVMNDGSKTNREVFWDEFAKIYGEKARDDEKKFDEYYRNEFQAVKEVCGHEKRAKKVTDYLKSSGIRVIIATNPIFPAVGTHSRMRWAGLDPDEFELVTTYENTGYCKPNPAYYTDILNRIGLEPKDCIMVGNDVDEDIIPSTSLGMDAFLLTDCLINKNNIDINKYAHGNFDDLLEYLSSL
ncbi:MAG: HAD family hydrolase [Clostridiales bacterium]|nr:HAD family hydrolase [Clostridiales bacterium]